MHGVDKASQLVDNSETLRTSLDEEIEVTSPRGRPSYLRSLNHRRFLQALRGNGPMSRSDLARDLGMSKVTVSSIANDLLERGVICEAGVSKQKIGRRAALLDLGPQLGVVAAVDVDTQTISARLADLRGEPIKDVRRDTPDDLGALVAVIASFLVEAAGSCGRRVQDIRHVKIAVPASVEPSGVVSFAGMPKYIEGSALLTQLQTKLPGIGVSLVNDMNAASIGEGRCGAARRWSKFAYLGVRRSGTGMGLVLNGRLYQGARGRAGEIGLLQLGHEPNALDSILSKHDARTLNELARVLATAFVLLDLEGIVIYTQLREGIDWFAQLEAHLLGMVPYPVCLTESELGDRAPLVGAIVLALDQVWKNPDFHMRRQESQPQSRLVMHARG